MPVPQRKVVYEVFLDGEGIAETFDSLLDARAKALEIGGRVRIVKR